MMPRLELAPAPFISDAVPFEETRLIQLVEERPEDFEVLFSLGNLLTRERRYEEAVRTYRRALAVNPGSAEVLCNLGITYGLAERYGRALGCLRRAGLMKPQLLLSHLSLARIAHVRGDEDLEREAYQRVLAHDPAHEEALLGLARVAELSNDRAAASSFYETAVKTAKSSNIAARKLAMFRFFEARKLFDSGEFVAAAQQWHIIFQSCPEVFHQENDVVKQFSQLQLLDAQSNMLEEMLTDLAETKAYYEVTLRKLFQIGLLPEHFIDSTQLDVERARWKQALEREGDHPYARFRLGLTALYKGELEDAIDQFSRTHDLMYGKKIEALSLPALQTFVQVLRQRERLGSASKSVTIGDEPWVVEGFENPLERRIWKRSGLEPKDAHLWRDAGFSARDAKRWQKHFNSAAEAKRWREVEFDDPVEARLWHRADIATDVAIQWKREFSFPAQLAIQCLSNGFTDPRDASEWMEIFQFPGDAMRWKEQGLSPRLTQLWLDEGIRDPIEARARTEAIQRTRKSEI